MNSPVPSQHLLRIGSFKIPVTVVALGTSAIVHGGFLTAAYFVTWSPAPASHPKVNFARGDQASRIQVHLVPWPDLVENEEKNLQPQTDAPAADSSDETRTPEKVEVVPLSEEVALEIHPGPPVSASEDRDSLADKQPIEAQVVEVRAFEEVREVPAANNAVEVTPRPQAFEASLRDVASPLARVPSQRETIPQGVDNDQPPVTAAVNDSAKPLPQEPVEAIASSSQTTGVVTGIETLDLPTPKYPSLSRRRGEEGLVLIQVEVLPDGSVGAIKVLRNAGFVRLSDAAIAAARKGRFKPAMRDGYAVHGIVRIPFRFVLR